MDYLHLTEEATVEKFFKDKMRSQKPEDYLIRVNRQPVPQNYMLQEKQLSYYNANQLLVTIAKPMLRHLC